MPARRTLQLTDFQRCTRLDNRYLHGVTGEINTNDIAVHDVDKHSQNDQQELNNKLSGGHDQH